MGISTSVRNIREPGLIWSIAFLSLSHHSRCSVLSDLSVARLRIALYSSLGCSPPHNLEGLQFGSILDSKILQIGAICRIWSSPHQKTTKNKHHIKVKCESLIYDGQLDRTPTWHVSQLLESLQTIGKGPLASLTPFSWFPKGVGRSWRGGAS